MKAGRLTKKKPPPITNRGVSGTSVTTLNPHNSQNNDFSWVSSFDSLEQKKVFAKGSSGRFDSVIIPLPDTSVKFEYSFIDYINFTFRVSDFNYQGVSDRDVVLSLSPILQDIFGFGVTNERDRGLNFYAASYDLGINGWGTVCIGGQKDTILVTVKGQGLMAAKRTWAKNLHKFLLPMESGKITRVDLAHDSFDSEQTLDDYLSMYKAQMFDNRGQTPNVEQAGNWIEPTGKGRTLYVGSRSSGKLLRIYEKGLQLGRGFSELYKNWVRTELELRNDGRIIPLDVLKNPAQYLAGAYPALKRFSIVQKVAETAKKSAVATVATATEILKNQFGKYIWVFKELYGMERAFEMLTKGKEEPPAKLDLQDHESFNPLLNLSPVRAVTFEEIRI